jgi:hypothetical protein
MGYDLPKCADPCERAARWHGPVPLFDGAGRSRGDSHRALLLAEQWPTTPAVKATFDLAIKGAVAPGTTSDATFAGPLAVHGIGGEALQLLRGSSILGALESKFRRVPFRTTVARETGSGAGGSWIGENLSTPVAATAFDQLSCESYKAATIFVLSNELLQLGNPAAERTVRETMVAMMWTPTSSTRSSGPLAPPCDSRGRTTSHSSPKCSTRSGNAHALRAHMWRRRWDVGDVRRVVQDSPNLLGASGPDRRGRAERARAARPRTRRTGGRMTVQEWADIRNA